jgi:MFS family permease
LDKQITPSLDNQKKSRIYYGYVVLVACFFIMTFASGVQYCFGVFFKPMLNEFGWTRASTSGPFSVSLILGGLFSILAGRLSDKFGPRIVVTFGGIVLSAGVLLMSQINNLWQLYLTFGVLVAVGSSAMYVPLVAMLSRWFPNRRGLMVGIGVSGIGFGIGVVPTIASQFIVSFDWRTSLLILGAASMVLIVLMAQFLKAEPDKTQINGTSGKGADTAIYTQGLSFREVGKTRQFWMIFVAWLLYGFFYQIGTVHTVPYATDLGMTALAAASILVIIGLVGIFARMGLGYTGDKFSHRKILFISFIFLAVAFVGVSISGTVRMLYVFAVLYGAFSGVGILLAPMLAEYFGYKSLGAITGVMMFSNNIGGAISPTLAGYIFDTTGTYRLAFIISGAIAVAAAIFVWMLKPASKHPIIT